MPIRTAAKFRTVHCEMDSSHNTIELIDNNWGPNDPREYAGFTNNSRLNITSTLYGDLVNDGVAFQFPIPFRFMT